jgi:hypothetical protein
VRGLGVRSGSKIDSYTRGHEHERSGTRGETSMEIDTMVMGPPSEGKTGRCGGYDEKKIMRSCDRKLNFCEAIRNHDKDA